MTNTYNGESKEFNNWFEMMKATSDRFKNENDDLEVILEGNIGFHAYFVADGDDPTRGCHTAIYQGIYECLKEVSVDADIVEARHREVTPETVWSEMEDQLNEHTYLSSQLMKPIEEQVKKCVRKNQRAISSDE